MARRHEPAEQNPKQDESREGSSKPDAGPDRGGVDPERIARRAYERFRARGGEHGRDQEDWFAAEKELEERDRPAPDEIAGDVDARRLEKSADRIGGGDEPSPENEETEKNRERQKTR